MSVLSFAETTQLLHPFERPFSAEAGAHMLSRFTFSQGHTHMEVALPSLTLTLTLTPTLTLIPARREEGHRAAPWQHRLHAAQPGFVDLDRRDVLVRG